MEHEAATHCRDERAYHGPRLALGARHGDSLLSGIVQQVVPALESLVKFGDTPGRNDLDGGLQGIEGQFEADLVVALSGTAMGNELAPLLLGDLDLRTGNDGTSERCAEQVCEVLRKDHSSQTAAPEARKVSRRRREYLQTFSYEALHLETKIDIRIKFGLHWYTALGFGNRSTYWMAG